jgi:two-component system sensor histidine kinase QseC
MNRPHSLQNRLLALVLGVVVAVWLVTAAVTWRDVHHELDELLDSHLAQAAALLVVQQTGEIEDDDRAVDAPTLHRYAPTVAFQVFQEGRLALRSANAPATPMVADGERDHAGLKTGLKTGFRTVQIDGVAWRVFGAHGGERDIQVYVGEQEASRSSILIAVLRGTLAPMLLALPLLALAAWWAVYRGMAPLRQLGRTLAAREPHALQPVALADAPTEMAAMLAALNALFDRIGALMEAERRFTADAAHELRTPIAAIRAQAQVALAEADDARRRHALEATLAGCDRAARLVDQLLTLSRLEAGAAPAAAALDLGALVRKVAAELAPQALHKSQTVELDAADACTVHGDATLLSVLVRNLVDNAIRYSPLHATVRMAVVQRGGQVLLTVEDSGAGMSEADSRRLGERFFRVLGSDEAGSGLGWSIVKRIAAASGAAIRVARSSALGGLSVEVGWPLAR